MGQKGRRRRRRVPPAPPAAWPLLLRLCCVPLAPHLLQHTLTCRQHAFPSPACRSCLPTWPPRRAQTWLWTAPRTASCCASTSTSPSPSCPASLPPWTSATPWARCAAGAGSRGHSRSGAISEASGSSAGSGSSDAGSGVACGRPLQCGRPYHAMPCHAMLRHPLAPPAEAAEPHQDGSQAADHRGAAKGGDCGGGPQAPRPQIRRGPPGQWAGQDSAAASTSIRLCTPLGL